MDKFYCKTCDRYYKLKTGPNYLVVCPFCKECIGSISDYGFGPIAPCTVTIGKEEFGQILQVDGYTLVSEKYHVRELAKGGYKDLACYKSAAETVKVWLIDHKPEHEWFMERNKDSRSRYTYIDLYIFALLCGVGLQNDEHFKEALDEILIENPDDEDAIDLKDRISADRTSAARSSAANASKDAILHTFTLMNESMFDKYKFGKKLMEILAEYYKGCELESFARKMYELWGFLPYHFRDEKPFIYLFGADDHLAYGNRKECDDELGKAFYYYDE